MVATTTGDLKGYTNREFVATTESWEGLAMVVNPLAGITNILSMANATKTNLVLYERNAGENFILHKADDQIIFNQILPGLYFQW